MRSKQSRSALFSLIFILFSGLLTIGNIIERDQTMVLMLAYFSSFVAYIGLSKYFATQFHLLFIFGIIFRLIFFFHLPTLSDDVYRFIWDGNLIVSGKSPFVDLPNILLNHQIFHGQSELFVLLNSPEYYSVYPPVLQGIFTVAVFLSDWVKEGSWLFSANVIRVFFVLTDIGAFFILRSLLTTRKSLAFWYFLNPLMMIEITGNLHAEGLVVFFILFSISQFRRNKIFNAGIGLGSAIATKFLPLIFLPAMAFAIRWKRGTILIISTLTIAIVLIFPLLKPLISGITAQSLSLYFNKFEFNASFYFAIRELGYLVYGYNKIAFFGPLLAVVTFVLILVWIVISDKKKIEMSQQLLICLMIYLSFSTTVHPWYIIPLIPLGLISGFYFPLVWSFIIFATYGGYYLTVYELPLFWTFLEYFIVFTYLFYEIIFKFKSPNFSHGDHSFSTSSLRPNDI